MSPRPTRDAGRASPGRWPGAGGARGTRPAWGRRSVAPPGPSARAIGGSPGRAARPRPRPAVKAARRLPLWEGGERCLNASTAIAPARRTVRRASAPRASVIGRDQPVQRRTASCSKPTSPLAASTPRSRGQRVPATRPPSSRGGRCGAKTREAVRAAGALLRRRPRSPRRQAGARGSARGHPGPSYHRGACVPSPARRRVQSSTGRAARHALPWRGRPPRPPYAWPETARPSARGGASHHRRRRRSCP
jgi:hypothetical protein